MSNWSVTQTDFFIGCGSILIGGIQHKYKAHILSSFWHLTIKLVLLQRHCQNRINVSQTLQTCAIMWGCHWFFNRDKLRSRLQKAFYIFSNKYILCSIHVAQRDNCKHKSSIDSTLENNTVQSCFYASCGCKVGNNGTYDAGPHWWKAQRDPAAWCIDILIVTSTMGGILRPFIYFKQIATIYLRHIFKCKSAWYLHGFWPWE